MSHYAKRDSELGYVSDTAQIEYLKFNNMRHSVLGYMLGDFDSLGNYYVSDEIVRELITMKKYHVDTIDNVDICHSAIKLDKQITFFVTFESDTAILSLAEKVNFAANFKLNSGVYSNINEYVLDVIYMNGSVNRNLVYQKWNIDSFPGEALDVFHMDDETKANHFGVINRFKYLLAANTVLLQKEERLEEIEAEYSNKILDILSSYPDLKEAVLKDIKEAMEEKKGFLNLDKPNFSKTLNEVIEASIEQHLDILSEKEQEKFAEEKHNVQVETNQKRSQEILVKTDPIVDNVSVAKELAELPKITTIEVPQDTTLREAADVARDLVAEQHKTEEKVQDRAVDLLLGKHEKPNEAKVETPRFEERIENKSPEIKPKDKDLEVKPEKSIEENKKPKSEQQRLIDNLKKEVGINPENNTSKDTKEKAGIKVPEVKQENGETKQQEKTQQPAITTKFPEKQKEANVVAKVPAKDKDRTVANGTVVKVTKGKKVEKVASNKKAGDAQTDKKPDPTKKSSTVTQTPATNTPSVFVPTVTPTPATKPETALGIKSETKPESASEKAQNLIKKFNIITDNVERETLEKDTVQLKHDKGADRTTIGQLEHLPTKEKQNIDKNETFIADINEI